MDVRKCKTDDEIDAALKVRRTVFVVEQRIDAALEFDGRDRDAVHIAAFDGEKVVGAARLLAHGESADIGRLAVLPEYRRRGIGGDIMREAECEARMMGLKTAVIHAQSYTAEIYLKMGYEKTSDEFMEAGIKHVEMRKALAPRAKLLCKLCGAENYFLSDRHRQVVCAKCGYRMTGRDLWQAV